MAINSLDSIRQLHKDTSDVVWGHIGAGTRAAFGMWDVYMPVYGHICDDIWRNIQRAARCT